MTVTVSTSTINTVPSTVSSDSDTSFTVQWSRSVPLPSSTWTEDATFMGNYVMGNISVFFPAVIFFGPSTVSEIQDLLERHCS